MVPSGAIGSNQDAATGSAEEPDTRRILAGLFRRAPLIVACTLLTAGAALIFSLVQTKQYTADASLLFRDPGFDQKLFGSTSDWSDPSPRGGHEHFARFARRGGGPHCG